VATRPPVPPFTVETAMQKVRMAEDAWKNTREPDRGACFPAAQMGAGAGLSTYQRAMGCAGNRIAVRFAYEWRDDVGHWIRSYGNENWGGARMTILDSANSACESCAGCSQAPLNSVESIIRDKMTRDSIASHNSAGVLRDANH
jgi:nuclear transport factor 2 (NTF2) superfamily protein